MNGIADLYAAVKEASVQRIRPKMMTVCAILFGLTPIMQSPVYQAGADVMKRIATPMIGGVVTSAILELLIYPVGYVIWRKRELGFMNNVKLQTGQLRIVSRLLLRNLLGAGSVFLFLVCRVRLCLFLRRLLARGFRRFVAHKHNAKVHGNSRQHSDGVYHYPGARWYGNTKQVSFHKSELFTAPLAANLRASFW